MCWGVLGGAADVTPWRRVFGWAVRDVAMDSSALAAVTEDTVVLGHVMTHPLPTRRHLNLPQYDCDVT